VQTSPHEEDEVREASKLTKAEWREYTKTVWHIANTTHPKHPAVFPIEIPHRLIKLFSFVGDVVLDPFAGTGTTVKAAFDLRRRAVAVELNRDYIDLMASGLDTSTATLVCGDSRDLAFLSEGSIGLVVTSPPYWNKANYGEDGRNIGNLNGYSSFLAEIRHVFAECMRVLQPGRKICVVTANVNQHTEHGLLTFPLAADFTQLLRDVGFRMVNEVIWSKDRTGGRWGSANGQRPIFGSYPYPPNFLFKNVHEHILIFAKPSGLKRTGRTVVAYDTAMNGSATQAEAELSEGSAPRSRKILSLRSVQKTLKPGASSARGDAAERRPTASKGKSSGSGRLWAKRASPGKGKKASRRIKRR